MSELRQRRTDNPEYWKERHRLSEERVADLRTERTTWIRAYMRASQHAESAEATLARRTEALERMRTLNGPRMDPGDMGGLATSNSPAQPYTTQRRASER